MSKSRPHFVRKLLSKSKLHERNRHLYRQRGRVADILTLCGYLNDITEIFQMLILQVFWQTPACGRAAQTPLNPVFTDVLVRSLVPPERRVRAGRRESAVWTG